MLKISITCFGCPVYIHPRSPGSDARFTPFRLASCCGDHHHPFVYEDGMYRDINYPIHP